MADQITFEPQVADGEEATNVQSPNAHAHSGSRSSFLFSPSTVTYEIPVLNNDFDRMCCIGNQKDATTETQQHVTDMKPRYDDVYVTTKVLSQTIFGDLRIAVHRKTKKIRAVKKFSKTLMRRRRTARGVFVRENFSVELKLMNWLRQCPHDGLIASSPQDEQVEDTDFRYLVMPFAPAGDLLEFIGKNRGKMSDSVVRGMFLQLISAIQHLHAQIGYIHGDISPENILVSYDDKGHLCVRLCDYGLACKIGSQHHCFGKLSYKAPEHFPPKQPRTAEPSADVFSLGVVMFIMYYGIPPFTAATDSDVYYQGLNKCRYRASTFSTWLRSWGIDKERSQWELLPTVLSMLKRNREQRPSLSDVKRMAEKWKVRDQSR